jgi:hypothetical protein
MPYMCSEPILGGTGVCLLLPNEVGENVRCRQGSDNLQH